MWDLWWLKCHWWRFSSSYVGFQGNPTNNETNHPTGNDIPYTPGNQTWPRIILHSKSPMLTLKTHHAYLTALTNNIITYIFPNVCRINFPLPNPYIHLMNAFYCVLEMFIANGAACILLLRACTVCSDKKKTLSRNVLAFVCFYVYLLRVQTCCSLR
jgi:hypothetical protein